MSFLRQNLVRAKDRSSPSSSVYALNTARGVCRHYLEEVWFLSLRTDGRSRRHAGHSPCSGQSNMGDKLRKVLQRPVIVQEGEKHLLSPVCLSAPIPCSPAQTEEPQLSNAFFRCYLLPFSAPHLVVLDSSVSYLALGPYPSSSTAGALFRSLFLLDLMSPIFPRVGVAI